VNLKNHGPLVAVPSRLLPFALLIALLSFLGGGCGTSETDSSTLSFKSSGCKSKPATSGLALTSTQTAEEPYDGLTCVDWVRGADRTTFRIHNIEGACGANYAGLAYVREGGKTITLSLTNPTGAVAGCGWCVYDVIFEVAGAAIDANLAVTVERSNSAARFSEDSRGDGSMSTFALPAASQSSGVLCKYGNQHAMRDHARKLGRSGGRNFPCDMTVSDLPTGCRDGLVCTDASADGAARCLSPCAAAADCGSPIYDCIASSCRLSTP
jgi:hypothetical protein